MSLRDIARAAIMEHIAGRRMEIMRMEHLAGSLPRESFRHEEALLTALRAVPHVDFSVGAVLCLGKPIIQCHIGVRDPYCSSDVLAGLHNSWIVLDRHDDTAAPSGGPVLVRLVHDASRREVWLFVTAPPAGAAPGDAA